MNAFAMKMSVLAAVFLCLHGLFAASQAQTPRIGFIVNGKLQVQGVSGGRSRVATAAEKQKWQRGTRVSAQSPDGLYVAQQVVTRYTVYGEDERYTSIAIVERKTRRTVMSAEKLAKSIKFYIDGRSYFMFDHWLPDSRHIAVLVKQGSSSGPDYHRYVININTGNVIAFNGWLAPDARTAIVADKEYDISDGVLASEDGFHPTGERKWYVATLTNGFTNYRFATVKKRPLLLSKNRFLLTSLAIRPFIMKFDGNGPSVGQGEILQYQPAQIGHAPLIEFSRDSKWALCQGYRGIEELQMRSYLISLTTGQVRALSGKEARFIY